MSRKSEQPYRGKADLSVLFGDEESHLSPQMVAIDAISLTSQQPRRYFEQQKMEQLIQSVKVHGVLENLLVRPLKAQENQYELIAGERRYRAAIAAGLKEVPVTIRDVTDEEALQLALVENLLREDLNPVEQTEGILNLLAIRLSVSVSDVPLILYRMQHEVKGNVAQNVLGNEQGQTILAVFSELGKFSWESFVNSHLPLLKLPTEILEALRAGKIAYTKAKAIAKVKSAMERQSLLESAIASDLTLSQIRERVQAVQPKSSVESPQATIQAVTRMISQSKVWEDPKKWKQIQSLLKKLEALVEDN